MKTIIKYITIFSITLIVLFTLLALTSKIPKQMVQKNIIKSQQAFYNNEKIQKQVKKFDNILVHPYADAVLLNIIYCIDSDHPVKSAMEAKYYSALGNDVLSNNIQELVEDNASGNLEGNVQYIRYWHGSMSIVRPLLVFFTLQQIYVINAFVLTILAIILIIILIKKKQIALAISFIIGLIMCSAFIIPLCLEYTWAFLIMLVTSIIAVLIEKNNKKLNILFFITGMVTCYLDFLTTEIITILVPVIMALIIRYKDGRITNLKQGIKFVFTSCALWFISYAAMWLAKWILASVILKINAFDYVKDYAIRRVNGVDYGRSMQLMYSEAIPRNLFALYPLNMIQDKMKLIIIPIILLIMEIIFVRKKDIKSLWLSLLLLLMALVPYARYLVLINHSYWHYFFTFRSQIITIMALILAMTYSFDEKIMYMQIRKKEEEKRWK